jgi:ribosomal protein L29
MKRNDIKALSSKTVAELHSMLQNLQQQLAQARMAKAARKPLPGGLPSMISDDIARVKVTLTEKMVAEAAVAAVKPAADEAEEKVTKK